MSKSRNVVLHSGFFAFTFTSWQFLIYIGVAILFFRAGRFSYEDYEKTRQENIEIINEALTDSDKDFLLSFLKGEPKWIENYNFSQYPSIRWKLLNLEKLKMLNLEKFNSQVELLEKALENKKAN